MKRNHVLHLINDHPIVPSKDESWKPGKVHIVCFNFQTLSEMKIGLQRKFTGILFFKSHSIPDSELLSEIVDGKDVQNKVLLLHDLLQ